MPERREDGRVNDILKYKDAGDCCDGAEFVVDFTGYGYLIVRCSECGTDLSECECGRMVSHSPSDHYCYALAGEAAFARRMEEDHR